MSEALKDLVSVEDMVTAVKSLHGEQATLLHYQVHPATTSVQGLTSLMLRVTATVQISPQETTTTSLIVKRPPVLESQKELMSEMAVFQREVAYFSQVVPILKQKIPELPLVNCLTAEGSIVIMEDLCKSGYITIGKSMNAVTSITLDKSYFHLVARKIAEIHAASLDVDWMKIVPKFLETDAMFEGGGAETFKITMNLGAKAIVAVMNHMYPLLDPKYAKWLSGSEYYNSLIKLTKYDPNYLNVMCHGDFWLNNMMFIVDSNTGKPLFVKFIDLQMFKFAPPSRDLLYFLYLCSTKKFRDENEKAILHTYVDAFNAAVGETPARLSFDKFMEEYEKSRWFGAGTAMVFRSLMSMNGIFPDENEKLTQKHMESIFFADHSDLIVKQFHENENFREEMTDTVDEIIHILDKTL